MMQQKYSLKLSILLIICYPILFFISACHSSYDKKNIDISNEKVSLKSVRFDRELFACDTNHILQAIDQLGLKHPDFTAIFLNEITKFAQTNDTNVLRNSIIDFITHKDYKGMMDTVNKKFPDTKKLDVLIANMFKHIRYYYPKHAIGKVYYFVSGLNKWSAITIDSNIGIGLDMHLGKSYPYYESVQIPYYQMNRCEPEYIPINVAKVIFDDKFPSNPEGKNLLELMIVKGKQLLFAEYCLPQTSDEKLIGYSQAQLQWCKENENMIWHYLSNQKLLYSTQWQEVMRYINDGPNSTGMPAESPGNIGSWIGWQIVRSYLKNNADETFTELMSNESDGLIFLRKSGYKPS
jgi:hypothetical protein